MFKNYTKRKKIYILYIKKKINDISKIKKKKIIKK